jgi:membrane protein DedA with SNARE-associated domain
MLRVPARRFAACAGLGAVLWTAYLVGLGFAGGRLLHLPPLLLAALLTALAAAVGLLAARSWSRLRPARAEPAAAEPAAAEPPRVGAVAAAGRARW